MAGAMCSLYCKLHGNNDPGLAPASAEPKEQRDYSSRPEQCEILGKNEVCLK